MNRNGKRLMVVATGLNAIRAVKNTRPMTVMGKTTRKLTIKRNQHIHIPILITMDPKTSQLLQLLEQRTHVILKTLK